MEAGTIALLSLLGLLIAGHIGILFTADLTRFLVAENIVLAALYALSIAGVLGGSRWGYLVSVAVALFSAGRVSRSIVGPRGEVGDLALQHVPLLALDLAAGLLALALLPA